MPKGYFLSAHRSPANPEKRQAYLELAGPAMIKAGGQMLASTSIVDAHENGVAEQTVLVEFESIEKAKAAYISDDYQAALNRWQRLLSISTEDAPWLPNVRANIAQAAEAGGIDLPPINSPDADSIAAAAGMTSKDQKVIL